MGVFFIIKWWAVQDLPSGRFADAKRLQAGLAVFALRTAERFSAQTKTTLCLSNPAASKAVCLLTANKKPCNKCRVLNGGQYRICLPVVLLTQNACRPGSRFLPCAQRNRSVRKQKQRCAFQILPQAKQFARLLPMEQKSTPNKWECFLLLNGGQYRI